MSQEYICIWCGEPLVVRRTTMDAPYYVHCEGGLYMRRCVKCYYESSKYPYYNECPKCGGRMIDDHSPMPRLVEKEGDYWGGNEIF